MATASFKYLTAITPGGTAQTGDLLVALRNGSERLVTLSAGGGTAGSGGVGPTGATGAAGATGPQGITGPTGSGGTGGSLGEGATIVAPTIQGDAANLWSVNQFPSGSVLSGWSGETSAWNQNGGNGFQHIAGQAGTITKTIAIPLGTTAVLISAELLSNFPSTSKVTISAGSAELGWNGSAPSFFFTDTAVVDLLSASGLLNVGAIGSTIAATLTVTIAVDLVSTALIRNIHVRFASAPVAAVRNPSFREGAAGTAATVVLRGTDSIGFGVGSLQHLIRGALGDFTFGAANTAYGSSSGSILASGFGNTLIGTSANATEAGGSNGTAVGAFSEVGYQSSSVGYTALARRIGSTTAGFNAKALGTADYGVALGWKASVTAERAVALGKQASASHADSVAIGAGTTTTEESQVAIGERTLFIKGGKGIRIETPGGSSRILKLDTDGNLVLTLGDGTNPIIMGTSQIPVVIPFTMSNEDTPLVVGNAKIRFHWPQNVVITGAAISVTTPQASGALLQVDVNVEGNSILSTKATIDNTEETSHNAVVQPVVVGGSFAYTAFTQISADLDVVGDGTATGLKGYLFGHLA